MCVCMCELVVTHREEKAWDGGRERESVCVCVSEREDFPLVAEKSAAYSSLDLESLGINTGKGKERRRGGAHE